MMRKIGRVAAFLAVFVLGAAVGAGVAYYHAYGAYMGMGVDGAAGHLLTDLGLARQLRLGEPEAALTRLDQQIDSEITAVAQPPPGVAQTALGKRALVKAKTYRDRFPSESSAAAEVNKALQGIQAEPRRGHAGTLTKPGDAAPTFAVTTIDGARFDLAKVRGKVVVLNLFSTTCGPCLQELPHLEREIWAKYTARGVVMIAIGRRATAEEMRAVVREKGVTFPVAADPDGAVYGKYAEEYVPQTYVIDPAGKIAYQCTGFYPGDTAEMAQAIDELLTG